jgi:serine/threonine-protein kinase RsbW
MRPGDAFRHEDTRVIQVHSPADMRPFFDMIEDLMGIMGYPRKDVFAVTLAVQEAVANAFRHGNRRDPRKTIDLRYLLTAAEVTVEVADQGPGFDPDGVPDPLAEANLERPGGRGLFLMQAYMTWVSFNREGNRVTLSKQRSNS